MKKLFSFNLELTKRQTFLLGLIIPVLLCITYTIFSEMAYAENARQKLLPSFAKIGEAFISLTTDSDARIEMPLLWYDTATSMTRLMIGIVASAVSGLALGLAVGLFPLLRALLNPTLTFLANINPMAILAILFMIFGTGNESKVALIMFGFVPIIIATIVLSIEGIPQQQFIKASTLGANQFQTIYTLIIPQLMPRLINIIRSNIGYIWVFIIAAESLAGTDGIGYRIAKFKRKMAMDDILIYVMWVSVIGYAMITACNFSVKRFYPWFNK
jgi:NitT/TauT family transport system permease protein